MIVDPGKTCFPSVIVPDVVNFVKVEFKRAMISCKRRIMLLSWAPLCSVMCKHYNIYMLLIRLNNLIGGNKIK